MVPNLTYGALSVKCLIVILITDKQPAEDVPPRFNMTSAKRHVFATCIQDISTAFLQETVGFFRSRILSSLTGAGKTGPGKKGPGKKGPVKTVLVKTVLGKNGPGKKGPSSKNLFR